MNREDAKRELERRKLRSSFLPERVCHSLQAQMVRDPSPVIVTDSGRRWGKSTAACDKAYEVCLATPNVTACLVGPTQGSISRNFWRTLRELNREYHLDGEPKKGTEGWSFTFPNGSQTILLPVDTIEAADKLRGLSNVAFVCVDESQRYKKDVLDYLLLDVVKAMMIDLRAKGKSAQLWLMGTPNPAGKIGTFYEYLSRPTSKVYHGTVYDNDKLGTREKIEGVIDEILAEENQTRDSSWYRREILGEWVTDQAVKVYHFSDVSNVLEDLPKVTTCAVFGDIGVRDADALAVVGWRDDDPTVYLLEECIKRGQDTLDLAARAEELYTKYDPIVMAFDGGGLGIKVIMTLRKLFPSAPIRAVSKPPVNLQVKALNTMLAQGFKCLPSSQFYAEVRKPEWVDGIANGKIQENGHSDIVPTMRYAAVEILNLLPERRTEEVSAEEERKAAILARVRKVQSTYVEDPQDFVDALRDDLD